MQVAALLVLIALMSNRPEASVKLFAKIQVKASFIYKNQITHILKVTEMIRNLMVEFIAKRHSSEANGSQIESI